MKKRVSIFIGVFSIILGVGIIFITIPRRYYSVCFIIFGIYDLDAFANPDLADEQCIENIKQKQSFIKKILKKNIN